MPNNVSTVQRARDRRLKIQAARSTMTTTSPAFARIERSPTGETFASLGAGSEGNESRRGAFFVVCLFVFLFFSRRGAKIAARVGEQTKSAMVPSGDRTARLASAGVGSHLRAQHAQGPSRVFFLGIRGFPDLWS